MQTSKVKNQGMLGWISDKVAEFSTWSAAIVAGTTMTMAGDAFAQAETVATNLQTKIVSLAGVLFPLSIICCCVALLFTHDEKALKTEWKVLGSLCLVYALLWLTNSGTLVDTIKGLF